MAWFSSLPLSPETLTRIVVHNAEIAFPQYLKADGPLYQSFSVPFLAIVGPEEVSRTIILISVLIPLEGKRNYQAHKRDCPK